MSSKDNPNYEGQETPSEADEVQSSKTQSQARGSQKPASHDSNKQQILKTLAEIATDFKAQLEGQQPKPFSENALKAVTTFNDIVSGLQPRFILVPPLLEAKRDSASQVSLIWTDETTNVDGYRLERCMGETCNDFSLIAQLDSKERQYTDTNSKLSTNTIFRYRLLAFNAALGQWESNTVGI